MQKHRILGHILLVMVSIVSLPCFAMVFDNRFIPLLQRPLYDLDGTRSAVSIDVNLATASRSFSDLNTDETGVFEMFGRFDQAQLAKAMVAVGCPHPLRSDMQGVEIPWDMGGKIQMQGISFFFQKLVTDWVSVGASWLFMRVNSRIEFKMRQNRVILGPGDVEELQELRRTMLTDLGFGPDFSEQIGFGDIDMFVRFGCLWDYTYKFRSIDAGFRIGGLFPTGLTHQECLPTTIPFGGNGFWGGYVMLDALFELKEDMKFGMFLRLNKRFANTKVRRMPVLLCSGDQEESAGEPTIFGAAVGPARVTPGVTAIWSPYIVLENLQDGLGFAAQYILTYHAKDSWRDCRGPNCCPKVDICALEEVSKWGSDYVTLNAFYDCGKLSKCRSFDPVLNMRWDIPARFFVSSRIAKTFQVSLGVTFTF